MFLDRVFGRLKLENLISTTTALNVSTLFTGTLASTAIPLLVAPILSRIFSPEHFGIAGLYISISMLLGVIAYSHYSHVIILGKDDDEARQSVWLTLTITAIVSVLTLSIVGGLFLLTRIAETSAVGIWLFLIPASIMMNGAINALSMWANRLQRYKTLARNRVFQALTTVAVQLIVGFSIPGETGLILGLLAGQLAGSLLMIREFYFRSEFYIGRPVPSSFMGIANRHRSLAIYSTPSEFINGLINQAPIFLLQKFAGITAVGHYAFTQRLLGIPQLLVSGAITDVFKQRAAASYHAEGNSRRVFIKTLRSLAVIGFVPLLVLIFFAPAIIVFVFGENWREAGVFAQMLGVLYYLRFVVSPLSYMYFIAGKVAEDFYLHILFLASSIVAFYAGFLLFEDSSMLVLCYSVTYSIMYLIYLFRSYKFSGDVKFPERVLRGG